MENSAGQLHCLMGEPSVRFFVRGLARENQGMKRISFLQIFVSRILLERIIKIREMKPCIKISIILIMIIFVPLYQLSAEKKITQIELILDASRSMRNRINGISKITIARNTLNRLVDELKLRKDLYVGLRVFGHKNKLCRNSVLEVPIKNNFAEEIKRVVKKVVPIGNTPIAYSLRKAPHDFDKKIKGKKIIIIITDGYETCGKNPCEVSLKLKEAGIISKIHIVGLGIPETLIEPLNCIVKPYGGVVVRADEEKQLKTELNRLISEESIAVEKKEKPLINNLILTGTDINDNRIVIKAEALRNNSVVQKAEGFTAAFKLDPGNYKVKIIDVKTGRYLTLDNIKIIKNRVLKRNVFFGKALLNLISLNRKGEVIDTEVEIYESGTKRLVLKKERIEVKAESIKLDPGIYDIKVKDIDTNQIKFLKGIRIDYGLNEKRLLFRRGIIIISGRRKDGTVLFTVVSVYRSGSRALFKKSTGAKIHKIILGPGRYDIRVNDWYGRGMKWVRNFKISDGDEIEKTLLLE